jgi:hypothetical protein
MTGKHGPNSWDDYLAVHESRLADFADHFIIENRLSPVLTDETVVWEGELLCRDGIEIHVRKTQRLWTRRGRRWVQTTDYSYQVLRRDDEGVANLVRYDNAAHHTHPDPHHRHEYDSQGGEITPVQHVGSEGWPTLGDVIEEAFEIWRRSPTTQA